MALLAEYALWHLFGRRILLPELAILFSAIVLTAIVALFGGVLWASAEIRSAEPVRSFGRVLGTWLRASHEKICPVVEIR
jgi:hypothetical protein